MKKVIKIAVIVTILIVISVIIIKKDKNDESKTKIVCIDAGHGGADVGSVQDERYEKNDTLNIAKLIKQNLEANNIKVIMTRENDKAVSLNERCKIANNKYADLFVSIHRNGSESNDGDGIEIWVNSKKNSKDIDLANSILNKLKLTKIQSDRGVKHGTIKGKNTDYYVLNNTNMPSCLIELGFITNDKDNELFDNNIDDYAKAIADGIIEEIKEIYE